MASGVQTDTALPAASHRTAPSAVQPQSPTSHDTKVGCLFHTHTETGQGGDSKGRLMLVIPNRGSSRSKCRKVCCLFSIPFQIIHCVCKTSLGCPWTPTVCLCESPWSIPRLKKKNNFSFTKQNFPHQRPVKTGDPEVQHQLAGLLNLYFKVLKLVRVKEKEERRKKSLPMTSSWRMVSSEFFTSTACIPSCE